MSVHKDPTSILSRAALATLLYHDCHDMPLTAVEVWRWMLRPPAQEKRYPTLFEAEDALSVLVVSGAVVFSNGYYALKGRELLFERRLVRHADTQYKWRRLLKIAWWLQCIPFLRAAACGGSLAREHASKESDLDLFIVAANGRIWTTRLFLASFLNVFGMLRRTGGATKDHVCLNHYVTPSGMKLVHHSVYAALEYARLVPLFGAKYIRQFRDCNREGMERHLMRVLEDRVPHRKKVSYSVVLRSIQRIGETILSGWVGAAVERFAEKIQRRRMHKGTTAFNRPGRVIVESDHIEFHPKSPEAPIVAQFQKRAKAAGLSEFASLPDSGLTEKPLFSYTAH